MDYSIDEIRSARQKRADVHKEIREIVARAKSDNDRDLTAEENEQCERAFADSDAIKKKIDIMERLDSESRDFEKAEIPVSIQNEIEEVDVPDEMVEQRAYEQFLRGGMASLSKEERDVLSSSYKDLETRAQSLTAGAGGYTVPDAGMGAIVTAQEAHYPMSQICNVIETETGADLPIPQADDTGNDGVVLSENTQLAEQDITFTNITLSSFLYSSKLIRVSHQLLNDSAFDIAGYIGERLGERLARIQNQHATTGSGSGQPTGVVSAGINAVTSASATAVTYAELVDLVHAIDPAYHNNSRFVFNSATAGIIKKIVDGDSRPLWSAGMAVREPDSLLGFPYTLNQDMQDMTASKNPIMFGDFKSCYVRKVKGIQMVRMDERYADYLQVGFTAFERSDFAFVQNSATALKQVKLLLTASS
jgi:HK97 family phage major capsid protein